MTSIPVIDFAPFMSGSERGKRAVAGAIADAAQQMGFFYLTGAPVAPALADAALNAARCFFALPLEEKLRIRINAGHRGYLPMTDERFGGELKPNLNESLLIGLHIAPDDARAALPMHGPNQWLPGHPGLQHDLQAYFDAMLGFGGALLRAAALALQLDENFFAASYAQPMPFLRAVHYPPQLLRDEHQFGSATHTDNGCFTLLLQDDVGGLQIRRRDGGWIDAPVIAGSFIVNIGDMLMRWTNDRWVSTPHRVINVSGRERFSLPFFFNPSFDAEVRCIASCLAAGESPRYEPVTWGRHFTEIFDQSYAYRRA